MKYDSGITPKYHSLNTEELLATHTEGQLLKCVPGRNESITVASYKPAQALDWYWYTTLIALNENVYNSRKRARLMSWKFDLTLDDLARVWIAQRGLCALTGLTMSSESGTLAQKNPMRCSPDRKDNNVGYVRDNVRLLCHWANNAKSTYGDDVFYTMVESAHRQKNSLDPAVVLIG
jgi:hypothetical protein